MLRNLILDMGNVLVAWRPDELAAIAAPNEKDAAILCEALFGHPMWAENDRGMVSDEEMLAAAAERVPERLQGALQNLHDNWPQWLTALPGADAFVKKAKNAGLNVYLLSNAGMRFPACLARFDFYKFFDGAMVSAHEQMNKPDRRLYLRLLQKFGLASDECLFVDDMQVNVDGARAVGIDAVIFDGNYEDITRALAVRGINL